MPNTCVVTRIRKSKQAKLNNSHLNHLWYNYYWGLINAMIHDNLFFLVKHKSHSLSTEKIMMFDDFYQFRKNFSRFSFETGFKFQSIQTI